MSNAHSNNVSVISGTTNSVIASVNVGSEPAEPAFDPANGDLYVPNGGSDNVSVISGATNQVLASIPVGAVPNTPATYDSANGDIYISNVNSGNVSVISGSTNRVIATLSAGSSPISPTLDPTNGDLYVANSAVGSELLTVISGATNKDVQNITVGNGPREPVYDPDNRDLYVANANTDNLSVVSGSNNTIVATLAAGGDEPLYSPTFDSTNGEIYQANFIGDNVSVFSGSTNLFVASVPTGAGPETAAYDNLDGDLYVPNENAASTVTVISGTTNQPIATVTVGSMPEAPLFDGASGDVYVPNAGGNTISVISGAPLTIASFSASPSTITLGSSTTLSVAATGGAPPYTFAYSGLPTGCVSANLSSLSCTPTVTGSYRIMVHVLDTSSGSALSNLSLQVNPMAATYSAQFTESGLPVGTSWSVTLNGDMLSSTTATVDFTEANGTYSYSLGSVSGYTSSPSSGTVTVAGSTATQDVTFSPTGTSLAISSFSASPSSVEVGYTSVLSTTVSGGTSPYAYSYSGLPPGCSGADSDSLTCVPNAAGHYEVEVTVTDSASHSASAYLNLTVTSAPDDIAITSFTISPASITLGATTTIDVSISGGTAPYSEVYTGLPPGCSGMDNSEWGCTPTASGSYGIMVHVTDAASGSAFANASLTVNPASNSTEILGSILVTPTSTLNLSELVSATFHATPLSTTDLPLWASTLTWAVSPASLGSFNTTRGTSVTFTAGSVAGSGTVWVNATYHSASASASVPVVVVPASSGSSGLPTYFGLSTPVLVVIVLAVVAVVVGLLLTFSGRRARKVEDLASSTPSGGGSATRANAPAAAAAAPAAAAVVLPASPTAEAGPLVVEEAPPPAPVAAPSPVKAVSTCPSCGMINDGEASFCDGCGARI